MWVYSPGEGGVGVLASSVGTHCEMDPKSSGSDQQRQKSGDRPKPFNSGAVGHR